MIDMALNKKRAVLAALAAGVVAAAFVPLATGADEETTGGSACANADKTVSEVGVRKLRLAVGCLINSERTARDRRRVRPNGALNTIARRHTKLMVKTKCFKHECRGEPTLKRRIEKSGYVKRGWRYWYGEILGCSQRPASIVKEWMSRRYDRKNIVDRKFRHVGIGAKRGSPFPSGKRKCKPGRQHVTYTVLFGRRKR